MNNFDKFTLGNAPAAIYMIDLLNINLLSTNMVLSELLKNMKNNNFGRIILMSCINVKCRYIACHLFFVEDKYFLNGMVELIAMC